MRSGSALRSGACEARLAVHEVSGPPLKAAFPGAARILVLCASPTLGRPNVKSDTVYKRTYNRVLDYLAPRSSGTALPSEKRLSDTFHVSRTTVHKVLGSLIDKGILSEPPQMTLRRKPRKADYFPLAETVTTSDRVEKQFMEWMLRGDRRPGDDINGLELAREFKVSTSAIREYLNRFTRFGLVEKQPKSGWVFRGFTADFALELFEVRELFELRSALAFARQGDDDPAWKALTDIEVEHRELLLHIKDRYHDFSDLDERFHRLINHAARNRFMADFQDIISLIFHYHYQWSKADERERNEAALHEHLAYIEALLTRDPKRIETACRRHLGSARKTLLASIS
jgi:DNA-binding GntR family transcriptional regulator